MQDVLLDFRWDLDRLFSACDLPTEEGDRRGLPLQLLDLRFWRKDGVVFAVTPNQVRGDPSKVRSSVGKNARKADLTHRSIITGRPNGERRQDPPAPQSVRRRKAISVRAPGTSDHACRRSRPVRRKRTTTPTTRIGFLQREARKMSEAMQLRNPSPRNAELDRHELGRATLPVLDLDERVRARCHVRNGERDVVGTLTPHARLAEVDHRRSLVGARRRVLYRVVEVLPRVRRRKVEPEPDLARRPEVVARLVEEGSVPADVDGRSRRAGGGPDRHSVRIGSRRCRAVLAEEAAVSRSHGR